MQLATDQSLETTIKDLNNKFLPKVILVNHEKQLEVDTTCANLAIKYNMVYISAYQVIKKHIEENTEYGKKLIACKKHKPMNMPPQLRDEFNEGQYSAVHFDTPLVCQILKQTISEKRTNQKFVLLEGLCNSSKLQNIDD